MFLVLYACYGRGVHGRVEGGREIVDATIVCLSLRVSKLIISKI